MSEKTEERVEAVFTQARHLRETWKIYRDTEIAYRETDALITKAKLLRFRLKKMIQKEKK